MSVYTGIWMDKKEALVIHLKGTNVELEKIESGIETVKIGGGSRSKTPYGPMDNTSESKLLDRRKHQEKAFFKDISKAIQECELFFIMGPAEIKIKFENYWKENYKIDKRLQQVQTVDSISEKQKIERVKKVFEHHLDPK